MATVLVVDDDEKLLKMIQRTLVYEGFQVVTALNGREALTRMQANGPDLIVLDWMMPELNGLEFITSPRAAGTNNPILMHTARDAIEHRPADGMDGYPTASRNDRRLMQCRDQLKPLATGDVGR